MEKTMAFLVFYFFLLQIETEMLSRTCIQLEYEKKSIKCNFTIQKLLECYFDTSFAILPKIPSEYIRIWNAFSL